MEKELEVFNEPQLMELTDVKQYDLDRCYYRVFKDLQKYRQLRNKCFRERPIKLTGNYDFEYISSSTPPSSNSYTVHDQYIDDKTEFLSKAAYIADVTKQLTKNERIYFAYCLYEGKPETHAYAATGFDYRTIKPTKRSCIIKVACALGLDVLDGEKMSDEEEANYQIFKDLKGK